jgi:hypothetical protein
MGEHRDYFERELNARLQALADERAAAERKVREENAALRRRAASLMVIIDDLSPVLNQHGIQVVPRDTEGDIRSDQVTIPTIQIEDNSIGGPRPILLITPKSKGFTIEAKVTGISQAASKGENDNLLVQRLLDALVQYISQRPASLGARVRRR